MPLIIAIILLVWLGIPTFLILIGLFHTIGTMF